jgi:hypothetical protein
MATRITHESHASQVKAINVSYVCNVLSLGPLTNTSEFHLYWYFSPFQIAEPCRCELTKRGLERPQTSDNPSDASAHEGDNWQESECAVS